MKVNKQLNPTHNFLPSVHDCNVIYLVVDPASCTIVSLKHAELLEDSNSAIARIGKERKGWLHRVAARRVLGIKMLPL